MSCPREFSDKLIGVIPEKELDIDVVYADDYKDEGLAGKTITYKVLLKEIQEQVLPPVDGQPWLQIWDNSKPLMLLKR